MESELTMPDNESPDHAGLRAEARDKELILGARHIVDNMWARVGRVDTAELEHKICAFALDAYCKGRDSQSAELATLRGEVDRLQKDAVEKDREIAQMAAEMLKLRADLASSIASNAKWVQRELGKNARRDDPVEAK